MSLPFLECLKHLYNKYFLQPLLEHGLNPRAGDEKGIWVKPCKYYAYSIRAQKSASRHSSAHSSLPEAGEVFWKLSMRYINYIHSFHKINLRFTASLSVIAQTQTPSPAEVIFPISQTSLESEKKLHFLHKLLVVNYSLTFILDPFQGFDLILTDVKESLSFSFNERRLQLPLNKNCCEEQRCWLSPRGSSGVCPGQQVGCTGSSIHHCYSSAVVLRRKLVLIAPALPGEIFTGSQDNHRI